MSSYPLQKFFAILLGAAVALVVSSETFGATTGFNQTGSGPYDYTNTANWVGGNINGSWDSSLTLTANQTNTFAAAPAVATGLTFNYAGNFAVTLQSTNATAQTFTLGGDVSLNTGGGTSANVTIGNASNPLNIALGANRTFTIAASRIMTNVNVISGSGFGITNAGAGTLSLLGANTYSGGITVNAGIVDIQNNAALGTGTATLAGGTMQASGAADRTIANNIVAQASTTSTLATSGRNLTINGNISGGGNINRSAPSSATTVTLNGDDSGYTGTFTQANSGNAVLSFTSVNAGSAGASWVFQNTTAGRTRIGLGGASINGTISFGSMTGGGTIQSDFSGTKTISAGALGLNDTFSGVIANGSGTVALTKVGSGSMTLSGTSSSYTGTTTVENGALVAGAAVAVSANSPFGNASSAIVLGDAITVNTNVAMNPQLFTGGAFTMARAVTVGVTNATLGNPSTTFTLGGKTPNSSLFSGAIAMYQSLVVTQAASGTLTLSGGINNATNGTMTMTFKNNGPVIVSTNAISNGTQGGTVALTVNGASTVTLTNAHTYTGATTVSGGTLLVNGSTASGSTVSVSGSSSVLGGSGTISGDTIITNSGALTPRSSGGSAITTTFGGNLTITNSASANFTVSASGTSGNDKVVYGSSGTLTLDSSDTINVTCTTLDTANDYALFTSTGGTVSMTSTPTLKTNGVTVTPGIGTFVITNVGSAVLLHYVQASVPPTVNSASASPTSLGHYQTTTVTVNVTPQPGQSISSVTVTVDQLGGAGDPTTLTAPGSGDGSGNWTGTFTAPVTLAAGSYTISGTVNQSDATTAAWSVSGITVTNASPTWNGSGVDNKWSTGGNWDDGHGPGAGDTVAFAGSTQVTNNLDASVSLASLTFNSGAGSFDITNAANTLTLTGGLTNNSVNAQTLDVPVALSGIQTISAASGNVTINGAVSDSGTGFTLAGNSTLTLSAANTYTGPTTIGSGTLAIAGSGALGSGTYSAVITNNGALNYGSSASQTLSGIISGTGSVTNSGSGTLTLSGANTYSGGTTLGAGTINFANNTAFGTGSITSSGGTIKNTAGVTTANNMVVNSTTTFDVVGGNWNLNGNISGSGAINRGTAATLSLYLGGDNSGYTGTFTIPNNGNAVVRFNGATAGSAGARWVFNDTTVGRTTLSWSGNGTISFGSLTGGGQIQTDVAGAKTISVGALGLNDTFSGAIANGTIGSPVVALTKVGTGTMTLSGANTYTGNTTISNGVLALSGSGSIANSANIILSGATFDVSALSSTFTLGSGETFIVTNNATGTIAGNLNLGSGSLVLNYTNGTPSLLMTNGTFTFNNNAVTVTVSGTQLPGGSYKLISKATAGNAGLVAGTLPSSVIVNGAGTVSTATLQIIGDELYLVVNHPPVASTMNVTRTAGLSVKIAWSDLATNWTDADADAMSLNSFNLTTTNGVTLQTNSTWILYTNSVNVNDQFSYTIIDGRGATATGFVNIIINPFVTGQNTTVTVNGGSANVSFYGIPGYSYITQRATNIVTPNWVDISTNTAPGNGAINVTDSFSDLGNVPDSAYYRLKWQP